MISAQIDELRELAGDGSMEWVAGPIRASVLRDAADTIWQLRDDLQRANAENAKLRELVKDLLHDAMENVCFKSYWCDEKNWQTCNDDSCGSHMYVEIARELGVEVNE